MPGCDDKSMLIALDDEAASLADLHDRLLEIVRYHRSCFIVPFRHDCISTESRWRNLIITDKVWEAWDKGPSQRTINSVES